MEITEQDYVEVALQFDVGFTIVSITAVGNEGIRVAWRPAVLSPGTLLPQPPLYLCLRGLLLDRVMDLSIRRRIILDAEESVYVYRYDT